MKAIFLVLLFVCSLGLAELEWCTSLGGGGGGGGGDVNGPASATNNTLPRFSGPSGKSLKASTVAVDDAGSITTAADTRINAGDTATYGVQPFLRNANVGQDIGWSTPGGFREEVFWELSGGGGSLGVWSFDGVDFFQHFSFGIQDNSIQIFGDNPPTDQFIYWEVDGAGAVGLGPLASDGSRPGGLFSAGPTTAETELSCVSPGCVIKVAEGSNATMGVETLTAGTATVSTTAVTANSRIFLTCQDVNGGVNSSAAVANRVPGTSFDIIAAGTNTCIMAWHIIEPY